MTNPVQYIVYDMSITDIEERKAKATLYESGRHLANDIGISDKLINQYTNPFDKKQFYSQKLGKYFAIRVAKTDKPATLKKRQPISKIRQFKRLVYDKKLTAEVVEGIKADKAAGMTVPDLMEKYSVKENSIYVALRKK